MGRARLFVALLLLASISAALAFERPELVKSMAVIVRERGAVEAIGGSMSYLELNLTIPQNRAYQQFSYSGRTVMDKDGNMLAGIIENNPTNPYSYLVSSSGTSGERVTARLPEAYSVPGEYLRYTMPSSRVQSSDPGIRRIALEVTANATSDWERVARLATYVNKLVEYDIGLIGQKKDAKWVLANKRGVCVEYSTLFIALARAIGIPARFVGGYAYSNQMEEWQGHSWAEVYLGAWVPVDATWLEVGHIDGTHIETGVSADDEGSNNAYAVMSHGARLNFIETGEEGSIAKNIAVTSVEMARPINVEFTAGAKTLNFGEETVLMAKIQGADYRVLDLSMVPCTEISGFGSPISVLNGDERLMLLEPGKESYAIWKVRANDGLSPDYEYTCPILLGSGYLDEPTIEIKTTPTGTPVVLFTVSVGRQRMALGEEQKINYRVTAGTSSDRIGVAGEGIMQSASARIGSGSFTYVPQKLGKNVLYAYSSSGGVRELEFEVVPVGITEIREVEAPRAIIIGQDVNVSILIAAGNLPQRVRTTVSIGSGEEQSQQVTFTGETRLNFSLTPSSVGETQIRVVVEDEKGLVETSVPLNVFEQPAVGIERTSFAFVGTLTTVVLRLNATGEPSSINVSIGGRKIPAQVGEVSLEAEPGERTVVLEWLDPVGGYHSQEIPLRVLAKGEETPTPVPSPGETPTDPQPGCLGVILLLSTTSLLAVSGYRIVE